MKKNWHIIYTKANCEKKIAALLTKKKIENYCPLNRIEINKGNKTKVLFAPLFPSFVFVYISDADMALVRKISDVINFVYWMGSPAVVKQNEVEGIQRFTAKFSNISLSKIDIYNNGLVRIIGQSPVDAKAESSLMSLKDSTCKLLLPSMGYAIIAEIQNPASDTFIYGLKKMETVL